MWQRQWRRMKCLRIRSHTFAAKTVSHIENWTAIYCFCAYKENIPARWMASKHKKKDNRQTSGIASDVIFEFDTLESSCKNINYKRKEEKSAENIVSYIEWKRDIEHRLPNTRIFYFSIDFFLMQRSSFLRFYHIFSFSLYLHLFRTVFSAFIQILSFSKFNRYFFNIDLCFFFLVCLCLRKYLYVFKWDVIFVGSFVDFCIV